MFCKRPNATALPFGGFVARLLLALTLHLSAASAADLAADNGPTKISLDFVGARPSQLLRPLRLEDAADVESMLPIKMRDGTELAATLIKPRGGEGSRLPTILMRTPYAPAAELSEPLASKLIPELVRSGYVIVIVNDRGTQWSQGSYHWLKGANQDGYDVLNWIVKQSWSNARVGTFGCSSSAESQPGLATLNHPAHQAMVEMGGATAAGDIAGYHDQGGFYQGGVPSLSWAAWYLTFGHLHRPQLPPDLSQVERARLAESYTPQPIYNTRFFDPADFASLMAHLPSEDILRALNAPVAEWDHLIRLSPGSPEWAEYDFIREKDSTRVPGLHIDSWYDQLESFGTTKLFQHFARNSPNQHLIIGPTAHCQMGTETDHTTVGERDVGDARFDYVSVIKGWFDRWLKDIKANATLPAVQYYVLNGNRWESAPEWPPPPTRPLRLFLHSGGHANSMTGDGQLLPAAAAQESADFLSYDPLDPVPSPTVGGGWSMEAASEQTSIESRRDVLVYTSESYSQPMHLVGDVDVSLSVSSSAADTDLMVKLVDVYPDKRAYNVADTALRLRYRNGVEQPTLMQPGHIYDVLIHGMVTATDILPGHRLRIEISSSSFPNFERNLNRGNRNFEETIPQEATTQIYHDGRHPSFVEFHVLPGTQTAARR